MKFKCQRCNQNFTRKSNLIHHLKIKPTRDFRTKNNSVVEYRCQHCNMSYKRAQYADHINNYNSCKNYSKKICNNNESSDIKKLEIQLEIEKEKTKREVERTKQMQLSSNGTGNNIVTSNCHNTHNTNNTQTTHNTIANNNINSNNQHTYNIYNQTPQFIPLEYVHFGDIGLTADDLNNRGAINSKIKDKMRNELSPRLIKEMEDNILLEEILTKADLTDVEKRVIIYRLERDPEYFNEMVKEFAKALHMNRGTLK